MNDFQCKLDKSPKDYFFSDLLGGSPILVNRDEYREMKRNRCMLKMCELISAVEAANVGESFHPVALAPFWKYVSEKDFPQFSRLQSIQQFRAFGSTTKARSQNFLGFMDSFRVAENSPFLQSLMKIITKAAPTLSDDKGDDRKYDLWTSSFLLSADEELPRLPDMIRSTHGTANTGLIKVFADSGFIVPIDRKSVLAGLRPKKYLRINPLLTIMLRAEPGYSANLMESTKAYQAALKQLCAWRTKKWPWKYQYWNKIWDLPRAELDLDFVNFAAATEITINQGVKNSAEQAAMMKMATVLQRGAPGDSSRIRTLLVLWQGLLDGALAEIDQFNGQSRVLEMGKTDVQGNAAAEPGSGGRERRR